MWYVGFYHEVKGGREIVTSKFMVPEADWRKMRATPNVRAVKSKSWATRLFRRLPDVGTDVTSEIYPRVFAQAFIDNMLNYGVVTKIARATA